MSVTARLRGHQCIHTDMGWRYADDGELVDDVRSCAHCGRPPIAVPGIVGRVDACIGVVPGVVRACCGHGEPDDAYVVYKDGTTIRGRQAHVLLHRRPAG